MTTTSQRDQRFKQVQQQLGYDLSGPIKIGGHYVPILQDGNTVYISGQIPRVQDIVVVTGRVGSVVDLAQAQLAAKICILRALALITQHCGSLDAVDQVLRLNVYVQCTEHFTQQSEVADGASDLLYQLLGPAGAHTRTSVGVYQLPKNASVEVDLAIKLI